MIVSLVLDSVANLIGAQGAIRRATLSGGFMSFTGTIGDPQMVELAGWGSPVRKIFRGEVYERHFGGSSVQFVNEFCGTHERNVLTAHQLRKIAALDPGTVIFAGSNRSLSVELFIGGVELHDVNLIRDEFPRSIKIVGNW